MLLVAIGTRPEAIKLAPVILELRKLKLAHRVWLSDQHDVCGILAEFGLHGESLEAIPPTTASPARNLEITLSHLQTVLMGTPPAAIMAQGDTTTVAAAALAAFYHRIPFIHVEAGLRTGNLNAPWPEEFNRRIATQAASWHFCPTVRALDVVLKQKDHVAEAELVGNTGIDALRIILDGLPTAPAEKPLVLVSMHRRENLAAIPGIVTVLNDFADACDIRWLTNGNPAAKEPLKNLSYKIVLSPPLGYRACAEYLSRASVVLTDSGGLSEECAYLKIRTLILRERTERVEAIYYGTATLVGTDPVRVREELEHALDAGPLQLEGECPFGDGYAAGRIVDRLVKAQLATKE